MTRIISASEFKAKCLEILDQLGSRQLDRIVVTKRGRPVAVLTPPASDVEAIRHLHGFMRGSVVVPDGFDLTAPICDEAFTAETGDLHG